MTQSTSKFFTPERALRTWLWFCFYGLCGWQLIWHLWWAPSSKLGVPLALTFALAPLLPGLCLRAWRPQAALVFAGFGTLIHLLFASMEAYMGDINSGPAAVQSVICLIFFGLWAQIVRSEKRSLR